MKKIAIVTGGSGGIGRCTAAALRDSGCTVYELSRREKPADGIVHITADVTDEAQVRAAIDEVISREGRIDILVNNAGFGISGAQQARDMASYCDGVIVGSAIVNIIAENGKACVNKVGDFVQELKEKISDTI